MPASLESPAEPLSDTAALLRRYQKGDASAFRDLVRRYHPLVFAAALRRTEGRRTLAEDAAQLVFIDLARRAAGLKADERLGGWLHHRALRAAATLMRGEARRHAREQRAAVETGVFSLEEKAGESSSQAWRELAPHLDEALQRLSAADRDAVLLRCVEGRNFRAVGAALGLSDDAAQKRVSRALEKLRTMLLRRRGSKASGGLALSLGALASGLGADHARACAAFSSGEPLRVVAAAALTKAAAPLSSAARWLPQLKAAAAGSALACGVWAWPLLQEYQIQRGALAGGTAHGEGGNQSAGGGPRAIRFPVFPPVPKLPEEPSVEEIVRGMAALAAGPQTALAGSRFHALSETLRKNGQSAEALKQIAKDFPQELQDVLDRRYWRGPMLETWAEQNPLAALDYTLAHVAQFDATGKEPSRGLHEMLSTILREGRNFDRPALSQWYAGRMVPHPSLQRGSLQKWLVLSTGWDIAAKALTARSAEALRTLLRVENQSRLGLLQNLAGKAQETESLELLLSLAPSLETPALRAGLRTDCIRRFASLDHEGACRLVEAVADPEQRMSWAKEVSSYSKPVPDAEMDARDDWWLSMAPPELRDETAKRIASYGSPERRCQWLERKLSPEAFRNFLREQFHGQALSPIWEQNLPSLRVFAANLRRVDPQGFESLLEQVDKETPRSLPNRPARAKIQTFLNP